MTEYRFLTDQLEVMDTDMAALDLLRNGDYSWEVVDRFRRYCGVEDSIMDLGGKDIIEEGKEASELDLKGDAKEVYEERNKEKSLDDVE